MENKIYKNIKNYIKVNHGWDSEELRISPEFKKYEEFQNELKKFDGKKVKISFSASIDWLNTCGEKTGKIKVDNEGKIRFYEGRKTRRFYWLDGGLFEGWYATIIPHTIELIA